MGEANDWTQINGETVQIVEKLKYLQKEIKLMNETSQAMITKIREQIFEINELNHYIEKVKSNIDYPKSEQ